ncbi:MAG: AraC family transcriptional regulator [Sulfuricurvum sp.]|uniref:helix-turn-helix domain-containing protein n=1 Tax=Sulfuricurvum sp. TaxID=2025608 RepID=UPI0025DECCE5|nr:AraC family transcriptional regulator [Sulfuricurvum sp.]MCK9372794.1 AraC family transcriptional regulator [Sulfuricurvum sp.]
MSEIVNDKGVYEATLIFFDDLYIHAFIERHKLQILDSMAEKTALFKMDGLLKNLSDSYRLYVNKTIENKSEILKLKTEELLLHLYANNKERFSAFVYTVLSTADSRMKYLLESNVDILEDVAGMCALTRLTKTQLRKSVHNIYGLNPKEWLDQKRMEKACLLLKTTDNPIHSIATGCGYSTVSWFGSQFKKFYRLTPKEYREQNR